MFDAIKDGIGWMLAFFYDLIPSFGIAIVLLTIAINLLLFPLTLKQTRSTRAFQKLQPEVQRIQKEFKDNPEAMQRELMKAQKEVGATPFGCIMPMLVQMPIWFALFQVLRNTSDIIKGTATDYLLPEGSALLEAVKSGHQSFLGLDLGQTMREGMAEGLPAMIPYLVILALMMGSQYFQQWHAQLGLEVNEKGMTAQQIQQRHSQQMLTKIMPLFIGFISFGFPSGLVLYWTTSNLFRLGQQFVLFAMEGRPDANPGGNGGAKSLQGLAVDESDLDGDAKRPHPVSAKKMRRRRK